MEVISRKDVVNPTLTWIKRRSGRRFPITVYRLDSKILATIYSVIHISIHPSKELCSKMVLGEVGVSLP